MKTMMEKLLYDRVNKKFKAWNHYARIYCSNTISVYRRPFLGWKFSGLFGDIAVSYNIETGRNKIRIYKHWFETKMHYTVSLNADNFTGLIKDSRISDCFVLPYMRNIDGYTLIRDTRIVVITDKGQIYHNKPDRRAENAGKSKHKDEVRFQESAVWDLPGRLYPSADKECASSEYYFPHLPKKSYEYHPAITCDSSVNKYGSVNFGKSFKYIEDGAEHELSRFYIPLRDKEQSNPFFHIGGTEPDYKLSLMGTYRSNTSVGVRICIFATDDGGRNWFCKYEFGDSGEYEFNQSHEEAGHNWGNPIIADTDNQYVEKSICFTKRSIIPPSSDCKEPVDIFRWDDRISILRIDMNITVCMTSEQPHHLNTGNIIALQKKTSGESYYDFLCNSQITSKSAGNGLLFKVNVLDEYTFELFEYTGNPFNNICCRHIHQINKIKDGWLISTGEIYPNGWLLYFQMKESDTFTKKPAHSKFHIYRLNSSESSVQRVLGAILCDDENQTLIYASDHDLLERTEINLPDGRSIRISRSSIGIFKGKLRDIDDRNKFHIFKETAEPTFFFKKIDGVYYWCGMRGQFLVSENMTDWYELRLDKPIIQYGGTFNGVSLLDDYIVVFRR
ncbi:MAG TPA: hypothetical protein PK854_07600 [Oscillospiraceae bacterium]|nr:hypothetical protein [Oscillospiraceae bacterium]HPS35115.1 hypothetical protein [Oscillospiraceae bacterium]